MTENALDQAGVSNLCQEYATGTPERRAEVVSTLVQGIYNKSIRLEHVVMGLAPQLTSTEGRQRNTGMTMLSELLSVARTHRFAWNEVNTLVDFYLARMEDYECTVPCLRGLSAVARNQKLTKDQVTAVINTLFAQVRVNNLAQGERLEYLLMMEHFLETHIDACKDLGHEFVFGYVQAIDGEKDPRNLVKVFELTTKISKTLDISRFVGDLFEVTICYFPVTFNPPADDPHSITKKDIIDGLNNALAASPLFAEFGIPALFEKLESHVDDNRVAAFRTISICAPNYSRSPTGGLMPHMQRFWDVVKREMYEYGEKKVEGICLTSTRRLFAAVSQTEDSASVKAFTEKVVQECLSEFKDQSDILTLTPSSKIIAAITGASGLTCEVVSRVFVPTVVEQYSRPESYPQFKHALLEGLLNFVRAHNMLYFPSSTMKHGTHTASEVKAQPPQTPADGATAGEVAMQDAEDTDEGPVHTVLRDHLQTISGLFYESCCAEQPALRALACYGIEGLITSRQLTAKEVDQATKELSSMAMIEDDTNVQTAMVDVCATVARLVPEAMLVNAAKPILAQFEECEEEKVAYVLLVMDALATAEHLGTSMTRHATEKLLLCKAIDAPFVKWAEALDRIVASMCAQDTDGDSPLVQPRHCADAVVSDVLTLLLPHVFNLTGHTPRDSNYWNPALLHSLKNTVVTAARKSTTDLQQSLIMQMSVWEACFTDHNRDYTPYRLALYASAFVNLSGVAQPALTTQVLQEMVSLALDATATEASVLWANKILASACNKAQDRSALEAFVQRVADIITTVILNPPTESPENTPSQTPLAVRTWAWLVKGLLLRAHKSGSQMLTTLISWIGDVHAGQCAAQAFEVLVTPYDDCLCKASHAKTSALYQQRLFLMALDPLVAGYGSGKEGRDSDVVKARYLTALSYLLQYAPKQVLTEQLPPLLPMLLASLSMDSPDLLKSTLKTLVGLMNDAATVLQVHVDSLIPLILKLAHASTKMDVRMAALDCVNAMSSLPYHVLHPHKPAVLAGVRVCLGDKKRLVRRSAQVCNNTWYLI
ncbi:hypothetical protein SARC_02078 [Sphaeroforma arctica JP610]|uniref:MMS19 nucleotide excision repair protein n=1 Tax=Sphaeroforma arctica JP610 TaxID=667725 RepID=A0A0L0G9M9_9EUKA|nr:hypothetical protein SARC_02078 [Sphaeroforma arctica JP610]KNC85737.1 hypothetical protein SARC_02078 [Sphaeroforma arctica JP610]|eukprot:XP_014159639.1 hypothetical protein SARC_02078 [Sphaeroforma arctica JP610]